MFNLSRASRKPILAAAALISALALTTVSSHAADPLPSWNEGPAKQSIIAFVEKVTKHGSPDFVPVPERIATFDNDGTLWCEQPIPVQLYFVLDRVKALAPQHPEWANAEPFASLLKGDLQTVMAGGDRSLIEVIMATHAGMTTTEFEQIVQDWIATAKHPKTGQLFTDMVGTGVIGQLFAKLNPFAKEDKFTVVDCSVMRLDMYCKANPGVKIISAIEVLLKDEKESGATFK